MTFSQFLSILRARWWVVLLVTVLTFGVAIGVSLVMPKQYSATASVLVDIKPDPVSAMMTGGLAAPAFMASQVDIIKSARVAKRVVSILKLAENPQVREQWMEATNGQGSIEHWLAGVFKKRMEVVPSRESSVLTISYEAPDPKFAAVMANAFVQAYMETALELRVGPARQYASFFDERLKAAREALEEAQTKLSTFQRQSGIMATDERLDIETTRLNELNSQLVSAQTQANDATSRRAQATGGSGDKLQEVLSNPLVTSLRADLGRAEARLQELSSRFGDKHPQVIEQKAAISELRSRLETETRRVTGGVAVTADISQRRESQLRAALEAQREKVLKMKAARDEQAVLMREVESAQRTFDAIGARLNQTSMESLTTQSNVTQLVQASPPFEHSSPRTVLNGLVALISGLVLGIAFAMMLELRNRRLRTLDDVTGLLGLPLIGVLPRPPGLLGRGRGRLPVRALLPGLAGRKGGA